MTTTGISSTKGRQRRSPRLPKSVAVQLAGKGPDGKIFVESAQTENLSRHGACVLSRNAFSIGSPLAIRREGAKPARARVMSIEPGPQHGICRIGVEFVGDEGYWDCEFPRSWTETGSGKVPAPAATAQPDASATEIDEQKLAAIGRRLRALEASLEAVTRKAETIRAQAENTLKEAGAQIEAAQRQSAAGLASQLEALAGKQGALQAEIAAQVRTALQSIRGQAESAAASLLQHAAGMEQKVFTLAAQFEAPLRAGQERWQQLWNEQETKTREVAARLDEQMARHRAALAELESLADGFRKQTAATHANLHRETEAQVQSARGEMRAAAISVVRDFRQQLPGLGEEASRFLANLMAEQKGAASQLAAQSLDTLRAGLVEAEQTHRNLLRDVARQALDRFHAALNEKQQQAQAAADETADALAARLTRVQNAIQELGEASERAASGACEQLAEVAAQAEKRVAQAAEQRIADLAIATNHQLDRIRQEGESLQASAQEAARQFDQRVAQVQEMNAGFDRNARQKRQEIENAFASLMERYDSRKEALDRVLEVLESGRAALRTDLDSVRTMTEENLARLKRFTAEQETALKSRTDELERRLQASSIPAESAFQERVAASLESFRAAFSTSLEQLSGQERQRLSEAIRMATEKAAEQVGTLTAAETAHHSRHFEAAVAGHTARLDQLRRQFEEATAADTENLARQRSEGEQAFKETSESILHTMDERLAKATSVATEMVASVQQMRASISRESAEIESQMRRRQQFLETQLAGMLSELGEKRAGLEELQARVDQTRAELVQWAATVERHAEEASTSLQTFHRDIQLTLEKRAAALGEQLQQTLGQSVRGCEKELAAIGDAAQGVFQARVRSLADQAAASAKKLLEQIGEQLNGELERNFRNARAEHEHSMQELAQQSQQVAREELRKLQEAPQTVAGALGEQLQQMSRLSVERVREAHEMLLRDLPAISTEAEIAFRQHLERITSQVREEATGILRALMTQVSAEGELEMRRRLHAAVQSAARPNG